MILRNEVCNVENLQSLLTGDQSSQEYLSALKHVDSCSSCQSRLEEIAAGEAFWEEVQNVLTRSELNKLNSIHRNQTDAFQKRSPWHGRTIAWNESMASRLLSEPTHPEMLGRIGRYDVERLIGSGGMGLVFKAHDSELNRPVAVKLLAPYLSGNGSARKRFAREARAAAAVVDEHVVAIHNVESDDDPENAPFLVMKYIAGGSLQQRLDREGPLELCEVLRIGMHTARGLAAAHSQGLIHRDIKPSNILLDEGVERALLTDFGLARAEDDACLTRSGFQPGTPHYMSPEQIRGEAIDGRSDLFGLGCLMYCMCTGHPPFRAESSYAVLRRITDDQARSIREINPDVPQWLERVIMKLLAKSPEDRFESAESVAILLEECLAHSQHPTSAPLPAAIPKRSINGERRRPWLPSLVAAMFAFLTIAAGVVIVLELNKGTLKIESELDDVPISVMKGDTVVRQMTVTRSGESVRVAAGKYIVRIDGEFEDFKILDGNVTLGRGGSKTVRISQLIKETKPSAVKSVPNTKPLAATKPLAKSQPVPTKVKPENEKAIPAKPFAEILKTKVQGEYKGTLESAINQLSKQSNVNISFNSWQLQNQSLSSKQKIDVKILEPISFQSALQAILQSTGMTYEIDTESILVTPSNPTQIFSVGSVDSYQSMLANPDIIRLPEVPTRSRFMISPIDGVATEVLAKKDDKVKANQSLVTIVDQASQLKLSDAKDALEKATRKRDSALANREIAEASIAELEIKKLEKQVELLNKNMESFKLSTPAKGIIVGNHVTEGSTVQKGQVLFEIGLNVAELELHELTKEHRKLNLALNKAYQKAKDDAERDRISKEMNPQETMLPKYFAFEEKHRGSPQALEALMNVGLIGQWPEPGSPQEIGRAKCLDLVIKHYLDQAGTRLIVDTLSNWSLDDGAREFLDTMIEKSPFTSVRAASLMAQIKRDSQWIKFQNHQPEARKLFKMYIDEGTTPAVRAEGERLIAKLEAMDVDQLRKDLNKKLDHLEKYADVELPLYGNGTRAAWLLRHAINKVIPGAQAPELEAIDLDGKQFRLSEHRGKHVVLIFSHYCVKDSFNKDYLSLLQLTARHRQDVQVVGILSGMTPAEFKERRESNEINWLVLPQDDYDLALKWGIDGTCAYIVDAEGILQPEISMSYLGVGGFDTLEIAKELEKLLNRPKKKDK